MLTLVAVTWVALRANRVWPLVVASFQLLVVFAHLSVLISSGWDQVYWGMMLASNYSELIVTAIGSVCHHRRQKLVGRYRSWRLPVPPRAPGQWQQFGGSNEYA